MVFAKGVAVHTIHFRRRRRLAAALTATAGAAATLASAALASAGAASAAALTDTADAATLTAMRVPGYVDEPHERRHVRYTAARLSGYLL